jgi:hypothetical protein
MKWTSIILVLCVLVPISYAQEMIEVHLHKETYAPSGTVQADITLTDPTKPLSPQNIALMHEGNTVAISPFLKTVEPNKHVLFFNLPLTAEEGEYELSLNNLLFMVEGTLQEQTHTTPFTITKEPPYLAVFPGVIIDETEIEITLTNKQQTTTLMITTPPFISHIYQEEEILNEGASRTFKFTLDPANMNTSKTAITFTYEKEITVPIYLTTQEPTPPGPPVPSSIVALEFETNITSLNKTLEPLEVLKGSLPVNNLGTEMVNANVYIIGNLNDIATVTPSTLTLLPQEQVTLEIMVNEDKAAPEGTYRGSLVVEYNDTIMEFPMAFTVLKKQELDITITTNETTEEPQQDIFEPFFDYGPPVPPPEKKTSFRLIIITIVIILFIAGFMFLKKQTTKKQTFEDYLKKSSKR